MSNVRDISVQKDAITYAPLSQEQKQHLTFYSAPMAGITDKPFRQIIRHFTNAPLYSEMVGVASLYHNSLQTKKMIDVSDEKNIIVQLVGVEEEYMAYGAKLATDSGAVGIDINMGCPVKKLITNKSGASLMRYPDIAVRLVETVKKATSLPVSVKTRLGWDENNKNILSFAHLLQEAGADRITIHARTKAQGYSGTVDYELLAKVKESLSIPVTVNGDIMDEATLSKAYEVTKADSYMIGRALLGKPWTLGLISGEITQEDEQKIDIASLIETHLDLMLSYYGMHGLFVARKHLAWYAKGKKELAQFCENVYSERDIEKIKSLIRGYFTNKEG